MYIVCKEINPRGDRPILYRKQKNDIYGPNRVYKNRYKGDKETDMRDPHILCQETDLRDPHIVLCKENDLR